MAVFQNNAITEAGRSLLAHVQMGAVFTPTKIVLGSGYMPALQTPRNMTDVVTVVKNLEVSKIERNQAQAIFGGVYSNQDIADDWDFRELALYAKAVYANGMEVEECLYSYGNAGDDAERMPAYTTGQPVERSIELLVYIGQDSVVNLTIESGIYATRKGTVKHNAVTLTPESTGFATLLEYMASNYDIVPVECATVRGFSDLPNPNVAYQATINLKSGLLSAQLTDLYQVHTRVTNSRTAWLGGWTSSLHSNMTIEVGAGKAYETLQTAIDSVPKDLGGYVVLILVAAGTHIGNVNIREIHAGHIIIRAADESNKPTINGKVYVGNCSAVIQLQNLNILDTTGDYCLACDLVDKLHLVYVTFSGAAKGTGMGLRISSQANCLMNACTVKQQHTGVMSTYGSYVSMYDCTIQDCSVGHYASCGIIQISGGTNSAVDILHGTDHGGRIYYGSQTAVPNY